MSDNKVTSLTDLIKKKQEQKKQENIAEEIHNLMKHGKIEFVNNTDNDDLVSNFLSELKSIIDDNKESITFSVEYNIDDILNQKDNIFLATNNGTPVEKQKTEESTIKNEFHRNEDITDLEINAFLDKLNSENMLENEQNIIVEKPETPKKTSKILPFKK